MGTTLKLVNNLILGVAIHASAEALVLATKAGLDPRSVIEITSVAGAAREILRAAKSQGKGDLDSCVVMTVLEALANTVVQTGKE